MELVVLVNSYVSYHSVGGSYIAFLTSKQAFVDRFLALWMELAVNYLIPFHLRPHLCLRIHCIVLG